MLVITRIRYPLIPARKGYEDFTLSMTTVKQTYQLENIKPKTFNIFLISGKPQSAPLSQGHLLWLHIFAAYLNAIGQILQKNASSIV